MLDIGCWILDIVCWMLQVVDKAEGRRQKDRHKAQVSKKSEGKRKKRLCLSPDFSLGTDRLYGGRW